MRILFASSNLPHPPVSGGAQRTALLLRVLQEIGDVDCVFLQPGPPETLPTHAKAGEKWTLKASISTNEIRDERWSAIFRRLLPGRVGPALEAFADAGRFRWLEHLPSVRRLGSLESYDIIVARYLQTAVTLGLFGGAPLLLDTDDFDPGRIEMRLKSSSFFKKLTLRRSLKYSKQAHEKYLPQADLLWITNPEDRSHKALAKAKVLPNIPYTAAGELPDDPLPIVESSTRFLIVGTMSYSANAEGVDAFLRDAWPKVTKEFPQAEFQIIGSGMSEQQKSRWSQVPGVLADGFVPDLKAAYASCLAAVAPIQAGGGTNIKVLEAAAYGRVTILTPVAHRGFEATLPAGVACLRGENMTDLAIRCLELLRHPREATGMGKDARQVVDRNYTFDIFRIAVKRACQETLDQNARTEEKSSP